jgi:hypothetical protein
MARKPNYDFEKRRKEQERKAKKEAKAQRKLDNTTREGDDADAPSTMTPRCSPSSRAAARDRPAPGA